MQQFEELDRRLRGIEVEHILQNTHSQMVKLKPP
jgi:hypothetical protein